MATYTAYAEYVAYFSDPAEYGFARGLVPEDTSLRINPVAAALLFDIEFPPPGGPLGTKGFIFNYPNNPNTNINHPAPSGVLLDPAVDFVFVPGQATSISPVGPDMILYWSLSVVFRGPEYSDADPLLIAPIPQRRWVMGFEATGAFEYRSGSMGGNRNRDSSRVVDGYGIGIRSNAPSVTAQTSLVNSDATGLPSNKSWERFYIRIRKAGLTNPEIWRCNGTVNTISGAVLVLNPDRTLTGFNRLNSGTNGANFGSTTALDLDTWYRVDILVKFATVTLDGSFRLYLNGVNFISGIVGTGSNGLGIVQNHDTTFIGNFISANTWEVDFDDWHNAEIPNIGGVETLNSIDWLIGTHAKGVQSYVGTMVNWIVLGLYPILNQYVLTTGSGLSLTSTTALATLLLTTNALDYGEAETQEASGVALGPASAGIIVEAGQAGGGSPNSRSGYSVAGGGAVMRNQTVGGASSQFLSTYLPTGSIVPYAIEPLIAIWEKSNNASQATVQVLAAIVQYIGLWGPEDGQEGQDPGLLFNRLLHNCRYPLLGWTIMGPTPDAPVCVVGGTYVGNGTFQSINLILPAHLIIIRNTSVGIPVILNSTMFGPESTGLSAALAADIPFLGSDEFGQAFFTVVGNGARVNQNAVTYQYFAFCDPGLRYMLNGEFSHGDSNLTFNNPLIDTQFTPQFAMIFQGPNTPGGFWMKGPGQPGMEATTAAGTQITTAMQFALGSFISGTDISSFGNATPFSMFRTSDGSALVMIQTVTYVGNGLASRVIPLTPVSSRFPLIAIVQRTTSGGVGAVYRDTTHAGVNSIILTSGGNTGTGIIGGGVDSITVGSSLNTNGATFEVLVIPGSGSGWLNGTFCGPNGIAPGDFWEPPPEPLPPGVAVLSEGGLTLGDEVPLTLLQDVSGIYTLVPGKLNDTLYDRQVSQPSVDMEIPDPTFKTGYVGG